MTRRITGDPVAAELLEARVETATAARAVAGAAAQVIEAMPTTVAAEPEVYSELQRLACQLETAIAAADQLRYARRGPATAVAEEASR